MKNTVDTRKLKNLNKPTRLSIPESKRLHLWIRSDLKKYWIYRFTFEGKRHDISLGSFPDVSLADAKSKAAGFNGKLANGVHPLLEREIQKEQKPTVKFSKFAHDYIQTMAPGWRNLKHWETWHSTIKNYANPIIGSLPVDQITTEHMVKILTPIWNDKRETASRLRGRLEKIISAAITAEVRKGPNPAIWKGHLENLFPKMRKLQKHHEAMAYADIPEFMSFLSRHESISSLALQFTILTAARTSEVLKAKRSEITGTLWSIPPERMKANREHQVPLCSLPLEIIEKAKNLDPDSEYIFSKKRQCLSDMSMLMLLRGIRTGLTVHGFRSSFRDWVSELTDHSGEVAEMALSHSVNNKVEAAYRRSRLVQRRIMLMNDWQCYCLGQGVESSHKVAAGIVE